VLKSANVAIQLAQLKKDVEKQNAETVGQSVGGSRKVVTWCHEK
jgi:hypothetical protein